MRPVAVTLKRFLALDLVFILGISISNLDQVFKHDSAALSAGRTGGARLILGAQIFYKPQGQYLS